VLMACAAITIGTAVGWMLAAAGAKWVQRLDWSDRSRATLVAQLRLLPLASALALTVAQVQSFIRFEHARDESAGPLLITLAILGIGLAVDAVCRGLMCWRRTLTVTRQWREQATPLPIAPWCSAWVIEPAFPIVAVVGATRPQLFIARNVVERCTARELAAIAAHEAAHVASYDNLLRLLFVMTPGARLAPRLAVRLETEWVAATEAAADARASREAGSLELASALTKVARLAPEIVTSRLAASALITVSDLDTRIRRLLVPEAVKRTTSVAWVPAVVAFVIAFVTPTNAVSASLHELFEFLVRAH
jgi:Zn-dependent protease with chaperone function